MNIKELEERLDKLDKAERNKLLKKILKIIGSKLDQNPIKELKLKSCAGCDEDFYNGHNDLGVKECWALKDMKLILLRRVGIDEIPPWTRAPERLPKCYRQKGYVFVKPKQER